MYTVTPGITGMSPHTWDCRRAPSHLGLQVWTLHLGLQVWTLMPRITGVYCYTWDYWHAPSYLGLNACPLIPGIAGKHPHTWNSKCVPSHTWDYKGAPSHLGLLVWTLTPDFHGTFFFFFEEHAGDSCSDHGSPPSSRSHLHCSRSTGLDFLADLLPFVTSLPFYKASHTCFLQAQLRGCRKLYENKSILYSKHAWCPCQASSFPGCRHQRSYASFLSRAGLCCPHLLSDIH